MAHAAAILQEALKLPASERGRIIHELIESLEAQGAQPASAVEQAWSEELESRARSAQQEPGVDLEAACDALEAKRRGGVR